MSQALIRAAFETPLAAWAAVQSPALPVAWENVTFAPGTRHVRANLLPAATVSLDLLGRHRRYQGIFQVSLVMPQGDGMGPTEALVSSLEAEFPQHALFTSGGIRIYIVRPMSAAAALTSADDVMTPCSFRYSSDIVVS